MARNVANSVENNFTRGLITEASGLNFPENACTDTDNCHFELTGRVRRRLGVDFEPGYTTNVLDRAGKAISYYIWRNVAGDGNTKLLVLQVGNTICFYDISDGTTISDSLIADTLTLTDYQPAGTPPDPSVTECQYTDGNGYLFVTHPSCDPFYVSFNATTQTFTAATITLKLRDFVGVEDSLAVDERPASLTDVHKYNLGNQGWQFSSYAPVNSSTSATPVAAGPQTFDVPSGLPYWTSGETLYVSAGVNFVGSTTLYYFWIGTVNGYSGTSLNMNVTSFGPSDPAVMAQSSWWIGDKADYILYWNIATNLYPSNADVWWSFKDSQDNFNPRLTINGVSRGTTPAPKGRYVLEVCNEDRSTASGISGLSTVTTGDARPSTCSFFAGRVFYSGIKHTNYSANIYFSQILKPNSVAQFGLCYQQQDPTSETLFDLLPNDGGVISIPDAGTIIKLWSTQGGLIVCATNGLWQITGSSGLGFSATDYTVRKISSIRTISHTSFVDVGGYPAWWAAEGIYILVPDGSGLSVSPKSLTDQTILSFYNDIPLTCKQNARGCFDLVTKKMAWVYRSTAPADVTESYEFDKSLIFNTLTTAFNPWTFAAGTVKVNGVFVIDSPSSTVKFLSSYLSGTYHFTFSEERDTSYVDWKSFDTTGIDFTSSFTSGYKVHGQGERKFQTNYVYIFSREVPSEFYFQSIWDYSNTGDSGRWSTRQFVNVTDTDYDVVMKRLKVRGAGIACQFKVTSIAGEPFDLIGWSVFESSNSGI